MVKCDTAQRAEVNVDMAGSAELIESALTVDGTGQCACSVANIGGFFESLFGCERGDPFRERLKEQVGFDR
jgi:hypothetical protein